MQTFAVSGPRALVLTTLALALAACVAGDVGDGVVNDDDRGGAGGAHEEQGGSGGGGGQGSATGGSGGRGGSGGTSGRGGAAAGGMGGGALGGSGGMASGGSGGVAAGGSAGVAVGGSAGMAAAGGTAGLGSEDPPAGQVPAIVAVGYGGIRVLSTDAGATWAKKAQLGAGGGDDQNLLRCVAWGRGLWITGGWQFFTSTDARTWTKRNNPDGCGLMQGCAYGNGKFVATCGESSWTSSDGLTWSKGGLIGSGGHTRVLFGGGKFAAWGDDREVYTSTDGVAWTRLPGLADVSFCDGALKSRADCGDAFRAPGLWLRGEWRGKITRSTNGTSFALVYTDDAQNSPEDFAAGYAPKD